MARRVQDHYNSAQEPPPIGECQCGCGEKTRPAPYTSHKKRWVKGKPLRYLHGHNRRKRLRYVVAPGGYKTDCWLWQLCKDKDGYGKVCGTPGKMAFAHRVYYEERHGPIRDGLELDHLCRVRPCVNPDHLEPVTRAENARRGTKTKLTKQQAVEIRRSAEAQSVTARRFGITQSQVSRIKAGLVWRDLPDPEMSTDPDPQCLPSLAEAGRRRGQQPQPDPSISKLAA